MDIALQMQDPDLAVVVPIYNVSPYLRRCVESIVSQTLPAREIILVDDGSTDDSGQIADELAAQHPHITVIHQENGGLSAARNTGIDYTQAAYIAFVDSDDYLDPHMFEVLLRDLLERDADIAIGGAWREMESGEKVSIYPEGLHLVWNKEEALIELNSYRYFNMSAWGKLFRRSLFEGTAYGTDQLRFPLGKISEDYYLMHQIIARAQRVVYTSQPLYHYIQRQGSISRNAKVNMAQIDASLAQQEFYHRWFPLLAYVADTAAAFSHMGIYSAYARKGEQCPTELLRQLRKVAKENLRSVLHNPHIPKVKKLQALSFCYCLPVYRAVVSRKLHR